MKARRQRRIQRAKRRVMKLRLGSIRIRVPGTPAVVRGDALLLESGGYLLLEDGARILLES